ncbi:MAG: glycosyltransferase family 4 protein [Terrimicrobiaceae bacterium]|nr:glycosyltransferase family 4 protein [Terrimicrobiaceae bacterium]
MAGSQGEPFAYLFERFPSFTQTFCFREVLEMRRQGVKAPIFSIRNPGGEPRQDFPAGLADATTYLPVSFEHQIETDGAFRRNARRAIGELRELWGGESEKRRIYEALWLAPEMARRGVAHVHTHFAGTAARTAFWLKRLAGVRYSFTAHANDIFCDEPRERLEMLIRDAECVITVSDYSARYLREQHPANAAKIHRVYNGIHLERFHRGEPDAVQPLIVSVGRYIEKKGFVDLIAACRRLGDRPFECRIVGQGPLEEELRAAAAGDSRIQIVGPKSEEEIAGLLARATVFALPCVNESGGGKDNLPTVIAEAMAAANPVISTPVAGIPEMVADGGTGYLVGEHDVERLAARLGELLDDPARARAMGEAGRMRCVSLFSAERTTAELRATLSKCGAFQPRRRGWLDRVLGGG